MLLICCIAWIANAAQRFCVRQKGEGRREKGEGRRDDRWTCLVGGRSRGDSMRPGAGAPAPALPVGSGASVDAAGALSPVAGPGAKADLGPALGEGVM